MPTPSPLNFYVRAGALPPNFDGTLPEILQAFAERLVVVADKRYNSFVVGTVEPANDQGPWLRIYENGRAAWHNYLVDTGRYSPVEAFVEPPYQVSTNAPDAAPADEEDGQPPAARLWFQTDDTGAHRTSYWWTGTAWKVLGLQIPTGPFTERPAMPRQGEKFFDTTLHVELIYDRGKWRTVSGSPGDIKFVRAGTIGEALLKNPGWEEFFEARSRSLVGATPVGEVPGDNLKPHAIETRYGAETHRLSIAEMPRHAHPFVIARNRATRNIRGVSIDVDSVASEDVPEEKLREARAMGNSEVHNNIPPSIALWCLEKE